MGFIFRFLFGGWIVRFIPWWIWLGMAWVFGSMAWMMYQEHGVAQVEFEQAMRSAPPRAIDISAFDQRGSRHPMGEVHLLGQWRRDLGVGEIERKYLNDNYIIVVSQTDPRKAIAVVVERHRLDNLLGILPKKSAGANQATIIRGFQDGTGDFYDIRRDLAQMGAGDLTLVGVIDPYFGDRRTALEEQLGDTKGVVLVALVFTAIALIAALVKFLAWRRRVAAKRPQKPVIETPMPAQPQPTPVRKRAAVQPVTTQSSKIPKTRMAAIPKPVELDDEAARIARQKKIVDRIILEKFGKISRKRP